MKILLAIATLGPGGAERVMTVLADAFAARGHQVTLVTLDSKRTDFFGVSAGVERIALGRYGPSRSWIARLYANLVRILEIRNVVGRVRPDVVISFITEMNILTLIACADGALRSSSLSARIRASTGSVALGTGSVG